MRVNVTYCKKRVINDKEIIAFFRVISMIQGFLSLKLQTPPLTPPLEGRGCCTPGEHLL